MSAHIIDGKAFAASLRARIAQEVAAVKTEHDLTPGLAVVLVGDDPASWIYVRNKTKYTEVAGMRSFETRYADDISQEMLLARIAELNADPDVHGILVQLPLPAHMDERAVIQAIDPRKDVDGFHFDNVGRLATGAPGFVPCTPLGCLMLLKETLDDLAGAEAVVIGRSNIVGKPMAQLLLREDCTVTLAHSRTRDLPSIVRRADIVVAAVGRPEMVRGDWLKPGCTVIDVGINRITLPDGGTRLAGDIAFDEAVDVVGAVTPVPGGVGPMTIACLLANTLTAAKRSLN